MPYVTIHDLTEIDGSALSDDAELVVNNSNTESLEANKVKVSSLLSKVPPSTGFDPTAVSGYSPTAGLQRLVNQQGTLKWQTQYPIYSGFSSNDNIALPNGFSPSTNSWEIVCHIRTGSNTSGQETFFCSASAEYRGVSMAITNGNFVSYIGEDTRWISDGSAVIPTSPDTEYYCKTAFDGVNAYTNSISTDGVTFTGDQTVTDATPISGSTVAKFGYLLFNNMNAFNGNLYMLGTYIKINGEYVFNGNTAVAGTDYIMNGSLTIKESWN